MSAILDPAGRPISPPERLTSKFRNHLRENWSKWLSVFAFLVAGWSATTAHMARDQARAVAKLDFAPDVRMNAWFSEIAGFTPHLRLTNRGPVEAIQVSVTMLSHRYYPSAGKIAVTSSGSENNAYFELIEPRQTEVVKFHRGWLDTNARLHDPPQHNVMEIRLEYRRAQDLRGYALSAFYFINPDGRWVSEADTSLRDPIYDRLKEAVLVHRSATPDRFLLPTYEEGDILHEDKKP